MTRESYLEMLENALEKYDRYKAMYPRGACIVFVASKNVLLAIQEYEPGNIESCYDTFYEPRIMRMFLKLRGVDICMILDCEEDIFSPAFVWNEETREIRLSNDRLANADMLIDEGRLYIYDAEQQNYRSTNYMVEAGIDMNHLYASGFSIGSINADVINAGTTNIGDILEYIRPWHPYSSSIEFESGIDYSALFNRIFGNKNKKAKAESELDPGNTKAIDDYLNSFARHANQKGNVL